MKRLSRCLPLRAVFLIAPRTSSRPFLPARTGPVLVIGHVPPADSPTSSAEPLASDALSLLLAPVVLVVLVVLVVKAILAMAMGHLL
jgi:hypothetical protein